MKKVFALILALILLASLCACKKGGPEKSFDKEGYKQLIEDCIKLIESYDEETARKVICPGMLDYYIKSNEEQGRDFLALLQKQFEENQAKYAQVYGNDWKLTYTIESADEKDAEGIQKYKEFDSFYFDNYSVNTDNIQAVTFVKVNIHIEGENGSNDKTKTVQCFCVDNEWYSFYAVMLGLNLV